VADPANPPSGCYFHPRCRYATDICRRAYPDYREVTGEHWVACHRAKELRLLGVGKLLCESRGQAQ
jgi:peptide/nickel transport system ATP-binding protein